MLEHPILVGIKTVNSFIVKKISDILIKVATVYYKPILEYIIFSETKIERYRVRSNIL